MLCLFVCLASFTSNLENKKKGIRIRERGTGNSERRREVEHGYREQGTESKELGTENREQRTENRGQGTRSGEQGTSQKPKGKRQREQETVYS